MKMNTLYYSPLGDMYECTRIGSSEGEGLKIVLPEPHDGMITVGKRHFKVTRGVCNIDDGALSDGCCEPILFLGKRKIALGGFMLSHGTLQRLFPNEGYIRELGELCRDIEERLASLDERLSALEDKIEKNKIF